VIDFGFKNVFKRVLNLKLGIFYSIKTRIKPFGKELIFIFATPLKRGIGK
jgi:hypothetical protein